MLLLNWKVAYGTTWAKVAAGGQDARIDKWAAYVKANYDQKFFLALHHEPENDVDADRRLRHDRQGLRGHVPPRHQAAARRTA